METSFHFYEKFSPGFSTKKPFLSFLPQLLPNWFCEASLHIAFERNRSEEGNPFIARSKQGLKNGFPPFPPSFLSSTRTKRIGLSFMDESGQFHKLQSIKSLVFDGWFSCISLMKAHMYAQCVLESRLYCFILSEAVSNRSLWYQLEYYVRMRTSMCAALKMGE